MAQCIYKFTNRQTDKQPFFWNTQLKFSSWRVVQKTTKLPVYTSRSCSVFPVDFWSVSCSAWASSSASSLAISSSDIPWAFLSSRFCCRSFCLCFNCAPLSPIRDIKLTVVISPKSCCNSSCLPMIRYKTETWCKRYSNLPKQSYSLQKLNRKIVITSVLAFLCCDISRNEQQRKV